MVDFNSETTIGTPAVDVVRILILQRRADLFEAWEQYKKEEYQGIQNDISIVRARLFSLFLELQGSLIRKLKEKDYKKIVESMDTDDKDIILESVLTLNEYLDKLNLTKIDTKEKYDKTRVEKEHKVKGL